MLGASLAGGHAPHHLGAICNGVLCICGSLAIQCQRDQSGPARRDGGCKVRLTARPVNPAARLASCRKRILIVKRVLALIDDPGISTNVKIGDRGIIRESPVVPGTGRGSLLPSTSSQPWEMPRLASERLHFEFWPMETSHVLVDATTANAMCPFLDGITRLLLGCSGCKPAPLEPRLRASYYPRAERTPPLRLTTPHSSLGPQLPG